MLQGLVLWQGLMRQQLLRSWHCRSHMSCLSADPLLLLLPLLLPLLLLRMRCKVARLPLYPVGKGPPSRVQPCTRVGPHRALSPGCIGGCCASCTRQRRKEGRGQVMVGNLGARVPAVLSAKVG